MNPMKQRKSNAGRPVSNLKRVHVTVTPNRAARDVLPVGQRSRTLTIENISYSQAWSRIADMKQSHDAEVAKRLGLE